MPTAYRLTLHPGGLPAFTEPSEYAWPSDDTVLSHGHRECTVLTSVPGAAPNMLVVPRATMRALREPVMPRVTYLLLRAAGWDIYLLGGDAFGVIVGWWAEDTPPVAPAGGVVGEGLGEDLLAALRRFATPRAG